MTTTPAPQESQIEQRLATLERQMADILRVEKPAKYWESSVGMWKDDELSREVDRLGHEWRTSVKD